MPVLNGRAQAFMGVGNGPASIDGVEIAAVGKCCQPLDDDHAIYQTRRPDGAYVLEVYDLRTGARTEVPGSTGCNELAAGGGKFLAYLAGRGLYGAIELPLGGVSLTGTDERGAAGRDGTLAYVPIRQDGVPTVLRGPGGERTAILAAAYGLQVLSPTAAVWNGAGVIDAIGVPTPRTLPGATRCRRVVVQDVPWLVYWTDAAGLVAHPDGDLRNGRVLERRPLAFHHDAIAYGGRLVVVWSASVAELPPDLRRADDVVRDYPVVDLSPVTAPGPEPTPVPSEPPSPAAPPTVTIADGWGPREGEVPLFVEVRAVVTGAVQRLQWLKATPGGPWIVDRTSAVAEASHAFMFDLAGDYVVGVRALDAAGRTVDESGRTRTVRARARVVPPTLPRIAPPTRLPERAEHLVGCCWPTPWPSAQTPQHVHLRMLALLGCTALRVNAHHERPDVLDLLVRIAEAGLRPWPTIDVTVPTSRAEAGAVLDRELPAVVDFVHEMGTRLPWITEIEVYNEPSGIGMLPPPEYARLCAAVGQAMREVNPLCRVYVAIEHVNTQSGESNPHWTALRPLLNESLYDGVAWHPYRRDVDGSHWTTRRGEFDMLRAVVPAEKRIVVTEFGFRYVDHPEETIGEMTYRELAIERALGIDASFVYAHVGSGTPGDGADFGIFVDRRAWVPRAAAYRIAQYTHEHKETHA